MLRLKASARTKGSPPAINMTPMVDMVFLLLIFFLLTSMALRAPVLDLNLPHAEQAEDRPAEETLHIVIRNGGEIEIEGEGLALHQIDTVLEKRLALQPEKTVQLSADQNAPFGVFVRVLDALHALNHHNLAIVTQTLKNETSAGKARP